MNTEIKLRKSIIVRTQFAGFHCWPDAPDDVAFLRNRHRHLFKVEAHFLVSHDDRQLEFFQVQKALNSLLVDIFIDMNQENRTRSYSCEMIAAQIFTRMHENFKVFKVIVSEDGENDGVVELYQ